MSPPVHLAPLTVHPAAKGALAMLDQCAAMIGALSDEAYTAPSERMLGSTIGQHVRHALDHFAAALSGAAGETIDYDHRRRATPVERSRAAALDAISNLLGAIADLSPRDADAAVTVRLMMSAAGDEVELRSTLARELAFAAHHAVHHHAMVASIASERGECLPDGFGKAPATLNHEQARKV